MTDGQISRDAVFALLSNRRRRQLLCLLVRDDESRSLRAIARGIVSRRSATESTERTDEAYRSVYVSLYQTHAPQLAAERIVDYDEVERTVRLAHDQRTETLLRIVGIEPWSASNDSRIVRLLPGVVVGAALCGLLALVDRTWIVPWATLVAGLLVFRMRDTGRGDSYPSATATVWWWGTAHLRTS